MMRIRGSLWLLPALAFPPAIAAAAETTAERASELAVTLYRAPSRVAGSIDLDRLDGFALISERRKVTLPAGETVLKFDAVADGIEPASVIVSGLAEEVIEKNRDAALLSPAALLAAAVGKPIELLRSNKTGEMERVPGKILADADGGVTFETAQGIEGLRCSGLPETFAFSSTGALSASPTLSVRVRSVEPATREVTLSYLARSFDWSADYVATLSSDGKSLDLGAWVTLANGNGVGFPNARTQVVAGRLNRESGDVEPIDAGGPLLAECWPRGSTSDLPVYLQLAGDGARRSLTAMEMRMATPVASTAAAAMAPAAQIVEEQLGDLKLYTISGRTTLAARQSKQVRLMDRTKIPVTTVYVAEAFAAIAPATAAPKASPSEPATGPVSANAPWHSAERVLRTMNSSIDHLGLPLPSGHVTVFAQQQGARLLEHEAGLRDLAVGEEVEIDMGATSDVQVQARAGRVDISNARAEPIELELRLLLAPATELIAADHPRGTKNGRPMFRLNIPAHATATVHYQLQRVAQA